MQVILTISWYFLKGATSKLCFYVHWKKKKKHMGLNVMTLKLNDRMRMTDFFVGKIILLLVNFKSIYCFLNKKKYLLVLF